MNQTDITLTGHTVNLNPTAAHDSSVRQQMFSSQLSQAVICDGVNSRVLQSGAERDVGKYTAHIAPEHSGKVLKIISKYGKAGLTGLGIESTKYIIYEYRGDNGVPTVDVLEVPLFNLMHYRVGFYYQPTAALAALNVGSYLNVGTILAASKAVRSDGEYCYGIESTIAYMTIPGITEDGFTVSQDFADKAAPDVLQTYQTSIGNLYYMLNVYGDETNYKCFPDVGENVRSDGVVMVLREYDPLTMGLDMTPEALRTIDYQFDKVVYAAPGSRVIDITVIHNGIAPEKAKTPLGTDVQLFKYHKAHTSFLMQVQEIEEQLRSKGMENSPQAHLFFVEQMMIHGKLPMNKRSYPQSASDRQNKPIRQMLSNRHLDEWHVEIHTTHKSYHALGDKIADTHGAKGVETEIIPTADMPRDEHGVVVDIIMDPVSVIKRLNLGQLIEMLFTGSCMHVHREVCSMVHEHGYQEAYIYLQAFYDKVSPWFGGISREVYKTPQEKFEHVSYVINHKVSITIPPEHTDTSPTALKELEATFGQRKGKLTYRGQNGDMVTTVDDITVATKYMIVLDKIPTTGSVAAPKLQAFGVPAKVSKAFKNSLPLAYQPIRLTGETEIRVLNAFSKPGTVASILGISNSPAKHRQVILSILNAKHPTNIPDALKDTAAGANRPQAFMTNNLRCAGIDIVNIKGEV